MRALVTGAAGFIGSHLVERLLRDGMTVRGVDCFTSFYPADRKRRHLSGVLDNAGFELLTVDLSTCELAPLVADVDVVFHLAGQPGVRASWADNFPGYVAHNVVGTQRLLEAVSGGGVQRFVLASSSSVYGDRATWPTDERARPGPASPYGVTKLAAEHLCQVYARHHRVPTVTLRYFTVYGPRQRPDMALSRLLEAARCGVPFRLYGTGEQVRDFTYITDVVSATVAAGLTPLPAGTTLNVAGGSVASLAALITLVEETLARPVPLVRVATQPGDVQRTGGATVLARRLLRWTPEVDLRSGVRAQADWHFGRT